MLELLRKISQFIYPVKCPICHDIVVPKGYLACPKCVQTLPLILEPRCKKCGKPLSDMETEYCFDCRKIKHYYEQGIGIYVYNKVMKKSIAYWKYHGRREYGQFFARSILQYGSKDIRKWKIDAIIPVPLHRKRMKKRGFNQAQVLAEIIGNKLEITVCNNGVSRILNTQAQKKLDNRQRFKNLNKAFVVQEQVKQYKKILIVDDIYTTGSTIDAISKALKEKGIEEVYFVSVCIGKGF